MKSILFLGLIVCAFANPDRSDRIVGGQDAAPGQIPSQASLRSWGTTFHLAGGVLISNRWVITSAEHIDGRASDSLNIALGINTLTQTFIAHRSFSIVIHNQYNAITRENNVALVQSQNPIDFTQYIQPAPLLSPINPDGMIGTVSGWGSTGQGPNSEILQWLTVIAVSCPLSSFPSIMCVDTLPGYTGGICTSDVGGPFLVSGGLIGVASWHATPCASQPDEFVRISSIRSWIGSVTGI